MPDTHIYMQDYVHGRHSQHEKPKSTSTKKHAPKKLGNPTPLGLSSFALSMMISGLYNLQAFGITQPNILVGVSLFTGGVVQLAAGMWEFKVGNTFGGTGFSAFGGFWMSFGVINIPNFAGMEGTIDRDALAIFSLSWLIFTVIFTLACVRTNVGVLSAFVFLSLTFLFETIYYFSSTTAFIKMAGVTGVATSVSVFYCLAATFLTPDLSPISLPVWDLSRSA